MLDPNAKKQQPQDHNLQVKNLDTGAEMDLHTAEEQLPQSINPLSLHIMRLTEEYTGIGTRSARQRSPHCRLCARTYCRAAMSHVLRHSPMWTACRSSISHPVEPSFSVSYCILVNKHCTTEVLGFPSFGSDCVVYVVRCVQDLNPHLQETLVEGRPTAIQ